MRHWRRAVIAAIVPVVVAAVGRPRTVMVGRPTMLYWGLPGNRGLHVGLAGSGHGPMRVAAPLVAIGINLRGYKECAVVLLVWRAGWYNRGNDIAGSRVSVLGGNATVVEIFAL